MKKQKWLFVGPLLVVFLSLAACQTTKEEGIAKQSKGTPNVHIMVDEREVPVKVATSEWNKKGKNEEVENGSVEEIAKKVKSTVSEPNALVQIYFNDKKHFNKAFVRKWENGTAEDIKVKDYQFELGKEKGEQVYEVLAYYDSGTIQYVFKTDVK